ncbi:MAG: NDP-sugar synthase [Thermoanaerobaculia bacterium]|nr:NDP-sugar synthase [Thermoanaerobaculia bacterium]
MNRAKDEAGPRIGTRALVLTAGLGTRLRPLTWSQPKPLLPLCGRPLVRRTLESLSLAGCQGAVLNLHHLPDAIPEALGDDVAGMPIRYSREDPVQGTLGALFPCRDFLGKAEVVTVVNGDSLCQWPVSSLLRRHRQTGADVTLLLTPNRPESTLGGGIAVDETGRVVQLRDHPSLPAIGRVRRHVFAGLHLFRPEILDRVPEGPGDVIDGLYQPLLSEGCEIRAVVTRRRWHDVGTPRRYLEAALDHAASPWRGLRSGRFVSSDARIADSATLRRVVVEAGAAVENGARVERSLIMSGAQVGPGAVLRDAILGPGVSLGAGSNVEGRLLTHMHPRHVLNEGESQLGGLLYTPLA